jgi:hypothetical protein
MPTATFAYRSEPERVAIERAVAFVAEMHSLAQATPDGQILHACEGHALDARPSRRASMSPKQKGGRPLLRVRRPDPLQAAAARARRPLRGNAGHGRRT